MKVRSWPLIAALLLAVACAEDPAAVTPTGQTAADAPTISEVVVKPAGSSIVSLQVKAVDPQGSPLSIAWAVDKGELSAATGPSVLWRTPAEAGVFSAMVEVTNSRGVKRQAVQQVQVKGDGQVSVSTPAVIDQSGTGTTGTGRFQVPTPIPTLVASVFVVGGNPNAPAQPTPTPRPAFEQPVATPNPGASSLTSPPPFPIATPTPTPPPASVPPSPTPTPRPPTPQPGVRETPQSNWHQVPLNNIPNRAALLSVHFVNDNEGFAVGDQGTILRSTNGGVNWSFRNSGIPGEAVLTRVAFASPTIGFVVGQTNMRGIVFRTLDGGATWQDISPPDAQVGAVPVTSLLLYNQNILTIGTKEGRVMRTGNATAAAAGSVGWTSFDTKPAARPDDLTSTLLAGACFSTAADTTVGWFTGDGIFQLDTDGNPTWQKRAQLSGTNIGEGSAAALASPSEIWMGTNAGKMFRSVDAGANWTQLVFNNREFGNGPAVLSPSGILDISFVDGNNGWFSTTTGRVYDTTQAGVNWRERLVPVSLNDMQIESRFVTDPDGTVVREFYGWGVGAGGAIFRFLPE